MNEVTLYKDEYRREPRYQLLVSFKQHHIIKSDAANHVQTDLYYFKMFIDDMFKVANCP